MSSILKEQSLSLAEAAKLIPGRPHVNTVIRWSETGYRSHVLKTFRVGGKRLTTVAEIEAFVDLLIGLDTKSVRPVSSAHAEAERRLDELGV